MSINLNIGDTRKIIEVAKREGLLRNQLAYVLATAYHETWFTVKPIKETQKPKETFVADSTVKARLTSSWKAGKLPWVKSDYWSSGFFGRGYVQLTHKFNYETASKALNINFVAKPDLVMKTENAAEIIVLGMKEGWFAGDKQDRHKLSRYITLQKSDFKEARKIVNGMDKAETIAGYARTYDKLLKEDGYGEDTTVVVTPNEILPEPKEEKPVSHTMRFWSWFTTSGGTALLPFVPWQIQLFICSAIILFGVYAISTMPTVRQNVTKLLEKVTSL